MIGTDFEKAIVALAAWREMRGEGVNAMLSVVFVFRTRAKLGWYHGTIYNNVVARNQVSSMTVVGDQNTDEYPDIRDPNFQTLLFKIEDIYNDCPDNLTNGACFYANLSIATSPWFQTNIVDDPVNHPRVAQLGRTTFFK
jgi:hypothetical protein